MSGEADPLAVFAGALTPHFLNGTDETTGWVRVVEAPYPSEAAVAAAFQAEALDDSE
ncbi:hypothetical protein [Streptomyces eurocidicus]|uniref:Uncharacterized protein n=1 Tax=Streptomyces eurocidicus TaxID=66423 RepID=A0A7W8F6I5_STREU|nr:hypothetical protein [Streptomyces eurocidicus]MBB5123214.1 hypothetical protein [Streptomyces eurocidicus]MBF6055483.1 hypothetical protein [Streptomyces eurocidicus]